MEKSTKPGFLQNIITMSGILAATTTAGAHTVNGAARTTHVERIGHIQPPIILHADPVAQKMLEDSILTDYISQLLPPHANLNVRVAGGAPQAMVHELFANAQRAIKGKFVPPEPILYSYDNTPAGGHLITSNCYMIQGPPRNAAAILVSGSALALPPAAFKAMLAERIGETFMSYNPDLEKLYKRPITRLARDNMKVLGIASPDIDGGLGSDQYDYYTTAAIIGTQFQPYTKDADPYYQALAQTQEALTAEGKINIPPFTTLPSAGVLEEAVQHETARIAALAASSRGH